MSLQAPLFLLALLAAPVAVGVYVAFERRGRRGRAAFASPAMLPAVAPERPRWRRHLPIALYLLALIVLVVALARPQVAVSVPVDQARILLVTDQSGSMAAQDVAPTRLDAARRSAGEFLTRVPRQVQVGAIAFNQSARVIQGPTTDRSAVCPALAAVTPKGSTATGDALQLALKVARQSAPGRRPPPSAVVLLSDGKSVRGSDPLAAARVAARAKVPIYTVSIGTPQGTIPKKLADGTIGTEVVPPDPETLRRIASVSRGQSFAVSDAARLSTVYERLGSQLTRKKAHRQITAGFAGGGLALMLVGAGLSLLWFGRVP
ncbi:MAG: VWA domain-containing protein [Solirubrobacteraceae bacterium]